MEIIKITYDKYSFGFAKPEKVRHNGVKFDDGKLAYQDAQGEIRTSASSDDLKKCYPGAEIETVGKKVSHAKRDN